MVAFVQPSVQGPEELALLLARNLVINPELANSLHQQKLQQQVQNPAPTNDPPSSAPIVYSISQHYHHSAHNARQPPAQQQQQPEPEHLHREHPERPSSEPPQSEQEACENLLRNHGVNPAALSPPQLQLFRIADNPQKMRLIELWTIIPPKREGDDPSLAWTSTSLDREEQLARMRLDAHIQEKIAQQAQAQQGMDMAVDSGRTAGQDEQGRWMSSSYQHYMEPYMANGYDVDQVLEDGCPRDETTYSQFGVGRTYRPATDPVYNRPDWQTQMQMENQYGAFEAARSHGQAGTADAMEIL
jgi:hypothetical protein